MASNTMLSREAAATTWPGAAPAPGPFDPNNVNLSLVTGNDAFMAQVVCYIESSGNGYSGGLGVRISSIFVILIVSSAVTFFPVMASRLKTLRIPLYVYLFARYFGAGVIIATAFIHLLDPAYDAIGPNTCVGMTGNWAAYSWPPAIALVSSMLVFLMDFSAERYVEKKYGLIHGTSEDAERGPAQPALTDAATLRYNTGGDHQTHQHLHSGDQDQHFQRPRVEQHPSIVDPKQIEEGNASETTSEIDEKKEELLVVRSFQQQIAGFLILEFGVLFHSVIIGLTLGSAGPEFAILYPVIVFHQSFEGLGIGARLSAIPFPRHLKWLPWVLCASYGLTTPISIAAGLGVRTTYNSNSFTANIVSGVLDSTSAGILLYTGFVELLARDFLFNPERTNDDKQLAFMVFCVLLGAGLMALLGKWA